MFLKRISALRQNKVTLLLSNTSVTLYNTSKGLFSNQATFDTSKNINSLYQTLKKQNEKKILILLDQQRETYQTVALPDLGSVQTKKRLNEIIEDLPYEAVQYTTTKKPIAEDPEWKFIISGSYLSEKTKNIIQEICDIFNNNIEISLLSSGYINIGYKIQNIAKKRLQADNKSFYFIYILSGNNELYELFFKNNKLSKISSFKTENSNTTKTINSNFNKNKKRLIAENVEPDKIFLIGLLPEPLRANIATQKNRLFFSPSDIYQMLTRSPKPTSKSYTGILTEILYKSFLKKERSQILDLKTHRLKTIKRKAINIFFIATITACFAIMLHSCFQLFNAQKNYHSFLSQLSALNEEQKKEEIEHSTNKTTLESNKKIKNLYDIIKSSNYSLETLLKISESNIENLSFQSMEYDTHNNSISLVMEKNTRKNIFNSINNVVKHLSQNLPEYEVSITQKTFSKENKIVIIIKKHND